MPMPQLRLSFQTCIKNAISALGLVSLAGLISACHVYTSRDALAPPDIEIRRCEETVSYTTWDDGPPTTQRTLVFYRFDGAACDAAIEMIGIHGVSSDGLVYAALARELDPSTRAGFVAVDLPGHGDSALPPSHDSFHAATPPSLARNLTAFVRQHKPERLICHSMGGPVCAQLLADELVDARALLINPIFAMTQSAVLRPSRTTNPDLIASMPLTAARLAQRGAAMPLMRSQVAKLEERTNKAKSDFEELSEHKQQRKLYKGKVGAKACRLPTSAAGGLAAWASNRPAQVLDDSPHPAVNVGTPVQRRKHLWRKYRPGNKTNPSAIFAANVNRAVSRELYLELWRDESRAAFARAKPQIQVVLDPSDAILNAYATQQALELKGFEPKKVEMLPPDVRGGHELMTTNPKALATSVEKWIATPDETQ